MAHRTLDLKDMLKHVTAVMNRPCKALGVDQREIGGKVVTVFYYSCDYETIGTQYRIEIFVNGTATSGSII